MLRKKKRREKKEALDLDITSLLDVLVILLVFLLKSYSASSLRVDPKAGIRLPSSLSNKLGDHAITLQISKTGQIWVDNELLEERNSFSSENVDAKDGKLISLYQKLRQKESENTIDKTTLNNEKFINLVMDQNLEYSMVRKVMHTAGLAGMNKFKFVVKGKY